MALLSHLQHFVAQLPPHVHIAQTPTPLQLLTRVSDELGGARIWIKRDDLTGAALSGNKVRKLEFVVAQAMMERCDTLITCGGVQSNHCRATVLAGAQLGLKVKLILRNDLGERLGNDGNLFLDLLAGADVRIFPPRQYRKGLNTLLQQEKQRVEEEGGKGFIIPTGASDEIGVWGYVNAACELKEDIESREINPEAIVVATGSGGTQAGLTAGCHLLRMKSKVIGMAVCDDAEYFHKKVASDISEWRKRYFVQGEVPEDVIHVNDDYIGPGYAKADKSVFETIQWLAKNEGIILDPVYTGKAFHGLVNEIKQGRFAGAEDIIFVHTGGIFGLLAQRNEFGYRPLESEK